VVFFEGLQAVVGSVAGHRVRVCHLLWYAFSFAGVAWLLLAYERWLMRVSTEAASWRPSRGNVAQVLLLAGWVLPIGTVHYAVPGWAGRLAIAGLTGVWAGAVAVSFSRVLAKENDPASARVK
jgi:hypothetical protein